MEQDPVCFYFMRKRSISLNGHRTSIALEPEFWTALERFAKSDDRSLPSLISEIDQARLDRAPSRHAPSQHISQTPPQHTPQGLASALRVYVLTRLQDA